MKIKIKRVGNHSLPAPDYQSAGAACFDLQIANIPPDMLPSVDRGGNGDCRDGGIMIFGTGFAYEIPPGHVMKVYPRSGLSIKQGIRLVNSVGIIDSDFRGEVMVAVEMLPNHKRTYDNKWEPKMGDRIAQAMIIPVDQVSFEEVETLETTRRGAGGFGSTGS